MDIPTLKQHALDFIKGMLAAVITAAIMAAVNYIGAHIPDLVTFLTSFGVATSTIKLSR